MKLLQINCVYKTGSTGKLVYSIHKTMETYDNQSVVCYGRGKKSEEKNIYKSCSELYSKFNNLLSRFTGIMYGGCFISTNKLIQIINKEKPDVVHVHCINGYFVNIYKIISYLKKNKINTVLTLHAEFMYTANCGHAYECEKWKSGCGNCPRFKKETKSIFLDNTKLSWMKMKNAFDGFENLVVVSVSPWLQKRAQISPILNDKKHITILNGVDTSIFNRTLDNQFKDKLNLVDKKIVFHATAAFSTDKNHGKGGYYVVEMAKRFLDIDDNIIFLIAGHCEEKHDIPSNVILLGNVTDQRELAQYYSMADVTLLTSKRETFSMIVAESLCCGTPVVGFKAGGPEEIAINEYSTFVPFGDTEKLFNELKTYLYLESFNKNSISEMAKQKYSQEKMVQQYQEVYENMINLR